MRDDDGRKLDHKTLEQLRIRAVRQIEQGAHADEVAAGLGMTRAAVYGWLAKYREGGLEALKARPVPGRPPSPWKMRAAIKVVRSGAAPEMNELTTKSVEQIRKNRRRPKSPVSQPVAGMMIAFAARYEVITHDTSSSPADSDPCKCGKMTLVTLVSRICMKATTMTVTVMAHFRVEEVEGASGAGDVIGSSRCARSDAARGSG